MSGLPIPPIPKDEDFEKMAELFIETYELLTESLNRFPHPKSFDDKRDRKIADLQKRYFEIIKHRNEQLLGQERENGV